MKRIYLLIDGLKSRHFLSRRLLCGFLRSIQVGIHTTTSEASFSADAMVPFQHVIYSPTTLLYRQFHAITAERSRLAIA